MIDLQDLSVVYSENRSALSHVTLHVEKGEFVFLVGPTGAGKSTLLKVLYREECGIQGMVKVMGIDIPSMHPREVPKLRRSMGVVFQDFGLLPNKTVFENVAFALRVIGAGRREIRSKTPEALDMVGMTHRCDAFPSQLSWGEQQRVAIARALVNRPILFIADEPTGNLDPDTSMGIASILEEINSTGTTVIVATHDKHVVDALCKRVVAFNHGCIVRDDPHGRYDIYDIEEKPPVS